MNDRDFFSRTSEQTLALLNRRLDSLAGEHDVEILYQGGVLTLEIEEPGPPKKIVISPNSAVSQIWISAQATSFKLGWDAEKEAFVFAPSGETLSVLVGRLVGEELGVGPLVLWQDAGR